jgi:hypothetical protein
VVCGDFDGVVVGDEMREDRIVPTGGNGRKFGSDYQLLRFPDRRGDSGGSSMGRLCLDAISDGGIHTLVESMSVGPKVSATEMKA